MTRIQDEWDKGGDAKKTDIAQFSLRAEHLAWLKSDCAILHPLPRRTEIATEIDADPRAMYWRQVRNGMWIRAALILSVFERDAEADRYYQDLTS
jgi:aspartate carbamoyltransferase catalytic subunit